MAAMIADRPGDAAMQLRRFRNNGSVRRSAAVPYLAVLAFRDGATAV
jgi:hypothetical protein